MNPTCYTVQLHIVVFTIRIFHHALAEVQTSRECCEASDVPWFCLRLCDTSKSIARQAYLGCSKYDYEINVKCSMKVIMGRDSLVAYKSSDPEIKEISKRSSGEAETVDIDLNINVNDNDEERINQPDLKKARTVDEDPATTEVSQEENKVQPIDCSWGKWGEWGQCSESCGTGFKVRTRAKTVMESVDGTCTGEDKDRQKCQIRNNRCEPVSDTAIWGKWSSWSKCNAKCPNKSGTQIRTRLCDVGEECFGKKTEEKSCEINCSDLCFDGNFCAFMQDTRCKDDVIKIDCPKKCGTCDIVAELIKAEKEKKGWSYKHPSWTCTPIANKEYSSYYDAISACHEDWQCTFVLDQDCDGKDVFKLCDAKFKIERTKNDCLIKPKNSMRRSMMKNA